jgi:alpha-beta hydrolase superfamily lysophospholipase
VRHRFLGLLLALVLAGCAPVSLPVGSLPVSSRQAEPVIADQVLRTYDGLFLPLHVWLPAENDADDDGVKAVVLALHGFNDYGNFMASAGAFFAERGIACYAYDQRGFGMNGNRGLWPGTQTLIADARAAVQALRRRHPDVPLYILGESMGGAVATLTVTGHDAPGVDGVILSAPAVWGRSTMPWYQTAALWLFAHTMPSVTLTGRGLGIIPSDNIEMLRALSRDPLVIKKTRVDAVFGLVNLMDEALAAAPKLDHPALILYGERDELVPKEPIRQFLAGLPASGSRRVAIYENGYHMLLRDLQAKTVWTDIAAWITDREQPLPSGSDVRATVSEACRFWNLCDKVQADPAFEAAG